MATIEIVRTWLVWGAVAASVMAFVVAATGGPVARAWRTANPLSRAVFLLGVAGITLFGGAKSNRGNIYFPVTDPEVRYLVDAGSGVSNDYVRVDFVRNILVPATASFFVDGCEICYTNDAEIASHTFNAYSNTFDRANVPFNLAYAAATNYNWYVYTDWVPPPVVHTNGVAYVVWQLGSTTNRLATTRTGVYRGALRLAPNPAITNGPPLSLSLPSANNPETTTTP